MGPKELGVVENVETLQSEVEGFRFGQNARS
jgi:hypothetical protein